MNSFKGADRNQFTLMPHDLNLWLPENHLARFVVDIVDKLDFRSIYLKYSKSGSQAYDPKLLLALIFYGYATGIFSSRKIEAATYDSVAFRFIAGNLHPDHDTIANFRKRFLPQLKGWFKEVLLIGRELGLIKLGNIFIDGTKVQANASKHKAMSYKRMKELEAKLDMEINQLMEKGKELDDKESKSDISIPEEIQRREDRLKKIGEAKRVIEQRRKESYKQEKDEYDQKMKVRKQKEKATGKKTKGREPKPPSEQPDDKDQYNFTDPESRIMKTGNGFDQCFNAQAGVNEDMIIIGNYSNSHCNDKKEFLPMLGSFPDDFKPEINTAVADTGYYSDFNIKNCPETIKPIIAKSKEKHNNYIDKILNPRTDKEDEIYRKRKHTVEPVFGIIKEVLGFRRFSLRGEENTDAEWSLVCLGYNLKRLFKLSIA
jgi:transposase